MRKTPFFAAWKAFLHPLGSGLKSACQSFAKCTLSQLEQRYDSALPQELLRPTEKGLNSRERIYTPRRTFWCFLWQCLNPGTPCREVVRQLQALFQLNGQAPFSPEDAAYCRARGRLSPEPLPHLLRRSAQKADAQSPVSHFLQGRRVQVVDGSTLTLPDTPANQNAYPQVQTVKNQCGFPMMRLVVLFSLLSGAILAMLPGNLYTSEMQLFHCLMSQLAKGDIVLGDRGFGNFVVISLLGALGVDFIGRSARAVDGRVRQKRLGPGDWLVCWHRGVNPSAILTPEQWAGLAPSITVRIVRGSISQRGFRVRQVTLVTTLLDPVLYPAEQILRAYLQRWRLEMCLDDLKTSLGMEMLSCKSPQMVEKEAYMYLIAHNLIRLTIAEAARIHEAPLDRISFKGSVDALRHFAQAMCQASSKRKRAELWAELLRTLAADLVPLRPGRREPRAIKRKKNKYPRLNVARNRFRDRPKRHARRRKSNLRKQKP